MKKICHQIIINLTYVFDIIIDSAKTKLSFGCHLHHIFEFHDLYAVYRCTSPVQSL